MPVADTFAATARATSARRQTTDRGTPEVSELHGPMHHWCFWFGLPEGNGRVRRGTPPARAGSRSGGSPAMRAGWDAASSRFWAGRVVVHPEMVLAHARAFALSMTPRNRRRNSIAADSSPSSSKMARIAAASASVTTNIRGPWQCPLRLASGALHPFQDDLVCRNLSRSPQRIRHEKRHGL